MSVGLVASFIILISRKVFTQSDLATLYKDLCDAFAGPGLLLIIISGLIFASNGGAFYGISFLGVKIISLFLPSSKRNKESYKDYCDRKRSKSIKNYSFLFFVGLIFAAVSIIFIVLYEKSI